MYAVIITLLHTISPQHFVNSQQLAANINKEIQLINNWFEKYKVSLNIIQSKSLRLTLL